MEDMGVPLYSTETVYRPLTEEEGAMLEVGTGCSWRRCKFCDFRRDKFKVFTLEEIEQKAKMLARIINGNNRLFLLGQNAFHLPAPFITDIFNIIKRELTSVTEVSMYARVDDINAKSVEELLSLRQMGLKEFHVGVESGCDEILEMMDKGVSTGEMLKAFQLLEQAGIQYSVTVIPGLGGRALSRRHAIETAELLKKINPMSVWCLALLLWENTPLQDMVEKGEFHLLSPEEILMEERLMLYNMEGATGLFVDTTVLGKYTLMGVLPQARQTLLESIDKLLANN